MSAVTITADESLVPSLPMKPEIKAAWVNRLLDPEARQGRNYLSSEQGDCCLGILCKMAVEDGVIEAVDHNGITSYDGDFHLLPAEVAEWAGLDTNPVVISPLSFEHNGIEVAANKPTGLAVLNDNVLNFRGIADVIKEQL